MEDSVGKASLIVKEPMLATNCKTGPVRCLSTSCLISLMEQAACNALETPVIEGSQTTVGAMMNIRHNRPSALGSKVTAIARVEDIDIQGLHFEIEAFDETGLVGSATHLRVFVDKDDFERKCYEAARRCHQ